MYQLFKKKIAVFQSCFSLKRTDQEFSSTPTISGCQLPAPRRKSHSLEARGMNGGTSEWQHAATGSGGGGASYASSLYCQLHGNAMAAHPASHNTNTVSVIASVGASLTSLPAPESPLS